MISDSAVTQGHSHPCHFAHVNSSISFHPLLKQPPGDVPGIWGWGDLWPRRYICLEKNPH